MAPQGCCVLSRDYLCSAHVAVTLALSATAEEAGSRPKKASGRNTLSFQGPSLPGSEVLQTGRATACLAQRPTLPGHLLPQKQCAFSILECR